MVNGASRKCKNEWRTAEPSGKLAKHILALAQLAEKLQFSRRAVRIKWKEKCVRGASVDATGCCRDDSRAQIYRWNCVREAASVCRYAGVPVCARRFISCCRFLWSGRGAFQIRFDVDLIQMFGFCRCFNPPANRIVCQSPSVPQSRYSLQSSTPFAFGKCF